MADTLIPRSPISHKPASSVALSLKCLLSSPSVPRDLPSSAWMTGWLLKFPQHFPPILLTGQVSRHAVSSSIYRQKYLMGLSI